MSRTTIPPRWRWILAVALLLPALQASAAKGPQVVPQLAGTYDGVHKHWRDTVTLKADGTYARGNGDPGTWTFDGTTLSLKWKNWGVEPVEFKGPGSFVASDGHLKLTQRNRADASEIPGTYDGAHPHWKDSVTINADGTYARGNGDPGVWIFDGKTLVLFWKNWGPEPVETQGPGKFASNGFRLTRKGGGEVAAPTPAPAADSNDPIVGKWAWKFDGDESIWGPPVVEFRADGTAHDARSKLSGTWRLDDKARRKYTYEMSGTPGVLILTDNNTGRGKAGNGREYTAERFNPEPTLPAPVPAVAPPPPPPPAPVAVENSGQYVKTDKRVYRKGEPVVISYFNMPGNTMDWVTVTKASDATDEWGNWEYCHGADGSRIVEGLAPGEYEARVYFNNSTDLEDKVAFTVVK